MKRFIALGFAVALLFAGIAPGASAQDNAVLDFETFFNVLFDPENADRAGVVVVRADGTVEFLTEGHAPIEGDPLTVDFSEARGAIDDTGDGADPSLDIVRGWGNKVHTSDAVVGIVKLRFDFPSISIRPFDGTTPDFPAESVVFGVETA